MSNFKSNPNVASQEVQEARKAALIALMACLVLVIGLLIWQIIEIGISYHVAIVEQQSEVAQIALRDMILLGVVIIVLMAIFSLVLWFTLRYTKKQHFALLNDVKEQAIEDVKNGKV